MSTLRKAATKANGPINPSHQIPRSKQWEQVFDSELDEVFQLKPHQSAERECLKRELTGLAISGGGIRSASFALGVMQALIEFKVHDRFHYMSTCSGGGYLGAAVTWLRSRFGKDWIKQLVDDSGTRHDTPGTTTAINPKRAGATTEADHVWLDYIRQHANYLKPPGLGWPALTSVAIRNAVVGSGVYIILLAFTFYALNTNLGFFDNGQCGLQTPLGTTPLGTICTDAESLMYAWAALILSCFIMYSLASYSLSMPQTAQRVFALAYLAIPTGLLYAASQASLTELFRPAQPDVVSFMLLTSSLSAAVPLASIWINRKTRPDRDKALYKARWYMQKAGGHALVLLFILAMAALAPRTVASADLGFWQVAGGMGLATLLVGALENRTSARPSALRAARFIVVLVLLISTGLVAAYKISEAMTPLPATLLLGVAIVLILVMFCADLNQFGIGRMYRDRLMEAFTPDEESIAAMRWGFATKSNGKKGNIAAMWPPSDGSMSLYPLINANAVLTDSKEDLYRGRGGDNFILSPRFCGSFATSWVKTNDFADGALKLGTAMAISGAAVHPNAAPSGQGFTRGRLASFVMFAMQVRLGSWVINPQEKYRSGLSFWLRSKMLGQRPNFIFPGIASGIFGLRLREDSYFLELSDGGHFDNTAAYELIRRRARLIVLVQASQDADYSFGDLANLAQKARVDFGVKITFSNGISLTDLKPKEQDGYLTRIASRGHAVAQIDYGAEEAKGWLVYLQATPVRRVSVDAHSYYRSNPSFPNEPTANQFFREAQFEAYRGLGHRIASDFLLDIACEHSGRESCHCSAQNEEQHAAYDTCLREINEILKPKLPAALETSRVPRRLTEAPSLADAASNVAQPPLVVQEAPSPKA